MQNYPKTRMNGELNILIKDKAFNTFLEHLWRVKLEEFKSFFLYGINNLIKNDWKLILYNLISLQLQIIKFFSWQNECSSQK